MDRGGRGKVGYGGGGTGEGGWGAERRTDVPGDYVGGAGV